MDKIDRTVIAIMIVGLLLLINVKNHQFQVRIDKLEKLVNSK